MAKETVTKIDDKEIRALKKDYAELKDVISKIQNDVRVAGTKKISDLQETGQETAHHIEETIRNNPRKAILYALGAGFVASMLLRR